MKKNLIASIFLIAGSSPAFAYIDPVTASIVLQALIGGFAAFLVAIRRFRERFFGFFRRKTGQVNNKDKE
jgi:hypothetical protein